MFILQVEELDPVAYMASFVLLVLLNCLALLVVVAPRGDQNPVLLQVQVHL